MVKIERDFALKAYNTFGVKASCQYFTSIRSLDDFAELRSEKAFLHSERMVLGGGSNILFTRDFKGLVIKNDIVGMELVRENDEHVWLRSGAGEVWHNLVMYCIDKGYAGLENLSLIPGNVGASPMQNIGAYGVEVKDHVESVECVDLKSGEEQIYRGSECEFGYRTSIFKTRLKGQKLIHHVVFKLDKKPDFNTSYGAIEQELDRMKVEHISIAAISQAVINIRRSKLPDPAVIGNAGSFFKNPVIPVPQAEALKEQFPDIPIYPAGEGMKKVAAGWLIEKAGWKGRRLNDHGVHVNQALVLVNYGHASGSDIFKLAGEIQGSIRQMFGIELEKEVNII